MEQSSPSSVWRYKPWWCQPWSILLTGTGAIAGSWLLLHRYWVTGLVSLPMLAWMGFFLILWPRLMAQSLTPGGLESPPGDNPEELPPS